MEQKVYPVSKVNAYIRGMFEDDGLLGHIWVQGEASNVSYHKASGHIYFSIKDDKSQLLCIMFSGKRNGLDFLLQDGQEIQVHGSINIFERDGKYQLYADKIRLSGRGELYERFLKLKNELEEEGLFSPMYKKKLPMLIKRLGIVTAQSGAALWDIINISKRRNPYIQLVLYPAQVQGEGAARSIAEGIKRLSEEGVDAIIAGRGGGSIEELWAFNEEIVARAIFESPVPVISAVGHATDSSISDYVADVYAPTPSAAAELAVVNIRDVLSSIEEYERRLVRGIKQKLEQNRGLLYGYKLRLEKKSPKSRIEVKKQELKRVREKLLGSMVYEIRKSQQELAGIEEKIEGRMENKLAESRSELRIYIEKMKRLSPLDRLDKGYAFVSDEVGRAVLSVGQLKEKSPITLQFKDGKARGHIDEVVKELTGGFYGKEKGRTAGRKERS